MPYLSYHIAAIICKSRAVLLQYVKAFEPTAIPYFEFVLLKIAVLILIFDHGVPLPFRKYLFTYFNNCF